MSVVKKKFNKLKPYSFRFRCLLTCLQLLPENAATVAYTCCVLHNFLIEKRPKLYLRAVAEQAQPMAPTMTWQDADTLANLQTQRGNTDIKAAKVVRNHLRDYYHGDNGKVSWQDKACEKHVSVVIKFSATDGQTDKQCWHKVISIK